jgi:hypothetical protein
MGNAFANTVPVEGMKDVPLPGCFIYSKLS